MKTLDNIPTLLAILINYRYVVNAKQNYSLIQKKILKKSWKKKYSEKEMGEKLFEHGIR